MDQVILTQKTVNWREIVGNRGGKAFRVDLQFNDRLRLLWILQGIGYLFSVSIWPLCLQFVKQFMQTSITWSIISKHYKHLEHLFKCCSSLELRDKRSLCWSVLFVWRLIIAIARMYIACRIARTTNFEQNTDVHMKMDMCMCTAWVGSLPGLCQGMSKSLVTPLVVTLCISVSVQIMASFLSTC